MGLAEPRKRMKISHDPNNLSWSQSAASYGQRLMKSQGWKSGQGLGARDARHTKNSCEAAKVNVSFKDDTLGLGASLKSKNIEHSRTGLDAFQGLLGRLNGRSDNELAKEVKKMEDRNLAMYTRGRWGGMTFVHGGLLIQGDGYKRQDEMVEINEHEDREEEPAGEHATESPKRKEERRREKEEKGQRKEEKRQRKKRGTAIEEKAVAPSEEKKKQRKAERSPGAYPATTSPVEVMMPTKEEENATETVVLKPRRLLRNGRHILRGRNIEAKKMAFSDAKMLDEIFMRKT